LQRDPWLECGLPLLNQQQLPVMSDQAIGRFCAEVDLNSVFAKPFLR
jgi:hypothetical protein